MDETLSQKIQDQIRADELMLGRFKTMNAYLLRDNEDFIRCFLAIGSGDLYSLRISLDKANIQALAECLDALSRGS